MEILVINGSPKGKHSVTLQTVNYLQILHPEHHFEVLHAGQTIKALEKDFSPALAAIEKALGHSRHHVVLTLPYSMGGMVETLHSGAKVNSVDYTAEGIVVDAVLDEILFGRLRDYVTKEC